MGFSFFPAGKPPTPAVGDFCWGGTGGGSEMTKFEKVDEIADMTPKIPKSANVGDVASKTDEKSKSV